VKTEVSFIKKLMILSLIVAYFLIAATYILYLPKYSPLRTSNNYARVRTNLVINVSHHMEHPAANMVVLLHQVYKSTIENKRNNSINALPQTALILAFLFFGSITLSGLLRKSHTYFKKSRYSHQYVYLNYRILRL
jgi:hypothetical protein